MRWMLAACVCTAAGRALARPGALARAHARGAASRVRAAVSQADAPAVGRASFAGLAVPAAVAESLAARGIGAPLPIQAAAVMPLARGESCVLHAATGSGKTLAFLLPILARMHGLGADDGAADGAAARSAADEPALGRALVLVPGQELAVQIAAEARALAAAYAAALGHAPLKVGLLLLPDEKLTAAQAADVATAALLIATPNPLLSALRSQRLAPLLDLHDCLVLDEVDALLEPLGKYATRGDKEARARHPKAAKLALEQLVASRLGPAMPYEAADEGPEPDDEPGATPPPRPTAAAAPAAAAAAAPAAAAGPPWRPPFQFVALSATVGRPLRDELRHLLRAPKVHALALLAAAADGPTVGAAGARAITVPASVSHAYAAAPFEDMVDRLAKAAQLLGERPAELTLFFVPSGQSVPKTVAALAELLPAERPVRGLFDALGGQAAADADAADALAVEGRGAGRVGRVGARAALLADLAADASAGRAPPVLVCSEESARGLDLPAVGLVLLSFLPASADRYVHLAGRTGRAGKGGAVVALVDWKEKRRIPAFESQLAIALRPLGDDAATGWRPAAGKAGGDEAVEEAEAR